MLSLDVHMPLSSSPFRHLKLPWSSPFPGGYVRNSMSSSLAAKRGPVSENSESFLLP
jgi:hypothetical protein